MNTPLVSVLTTAFNREKYIAEAIESVLNSTYKNFELIVIDDCSTDRTVDIARRYEQRDDRVTVLVNEKNIGDYPNRNKISEFARGTFIYYLDSDDTLKPDGLENLIEAMIKFPESGFGISFKSDEKQDILRPDVAIKRHFFDSPFLIHGPDGTILKKSFFEAIGKYPVQYGPANDMYFNLKAASQTIVTLIKKPFLNYRIHAGQEQNNKYSYLYNNYKYLRDAIRNLDLPLRKKELQWIDKKNKRRFILNIIGYFLRTLNVKKTVAAIIKADFGFRDAFAGIFHLD